MLKIQAHSGRSASKAITPNLLPCQIKHDGPVDNAAQYWKPQFKEDGPQLAYLRGRKLQGRAVKLPDGYEGKVTHNDGVQHAERRDAMYDDDAEEEQEEVGILNEVGTFDEVVVWGHGDVVEDDDSFVKGVTEWVGFAEAVSRLHALRICRLTTEPAS